MDSEHGYFSVAPLVVVDGDAAVVRFRVAFGDDSSGGEDLEALTHGIKCFPAMT